MERLEQNRGLIDGFGRFVYRDMDVTLFDLPLRNIDYLFDAKSRLHISMYNAQWELVRMTAWEKQGFLNKTNQSFDELNEKLAKTIRYIMHAMDYCWHITHPAYAKKAARFPRCYFATTHA